MSLEDRDWYREELKRRTGRTGRAGESGKTLDDRDDWKQETEPEQPREKPKVERVQKYKGTAEERRTYNNAPPAHTILAAKYELAVRRRTQKTFWAGVVAGIMVGAVMAEAIRAVI